MLAAEPWGILSKGVSPQKNIHVLPHCNSQRTGPVPVKMQLGGGCTSVIQFLCLLLRAVSHPNRDQDNNSPQTMKSYQYQHRGKWTLRMYARVKPMWQKHATETNQF